MASKLPKTITLEQFNQFKEYLDQTLESKDWYFEGEPISDEYDEDQADKLEEQLVNGEIESMPIGCLYCVIGIDIQLDRYKTKTKTYRTKGMLNQWWKRLGMTEISFIIPENKELEFRTYVEFWIKEHLS